jgi:hypothetical protein
MPTFFLPQIIAVTGKKRAGKDYFCDHLVTTAGYRKLHIADRWLDQELADMKVTREEYLANKGAFRQEIQRRAAIAREKDPSVLIAPLVEFLNSYDGPVCITGVRFLNEVDALRAAGAIIVKVQISDSLRKVRFDLSGESFGLFDDPFEREIDLIQQDLIVWGDLNPSTQLSLLTEYMGQMMEPLKPILPSEEA